VPGDAPAEAFIRGADHPAQRTGGKRRIALPRRQAADRFHPEWGAWLQAAEGVGARTIDGLGMLIHQAALQQLSWLGHRPDVEVMRRAAEVALRERSSPTAGG